MNVLSIGNSFSTDAQRYIYRIGKADGVTVTTFNLYIGACSLSEHFRNMLNDAKLYELEMNGQSTGFFVSLKEALLNRNWDVVTIQQVSGQSTNYNTYQPYLNKLIEYIRLCVPKAKIALQQTWAYEENSHRLTVEKGYEHHADMLRDIKAAYQKAAEESDVDFVIPSGELFGLLCDLGIGKIHRDTFHATLGAGRYALGLLWYSVLTGKDVKNNTFSDFDEEITAEQVEIIKKCVSDVIG